MPRPFGLKCGAGDEYVGGRDALLKSILAASLMRSSRCCASPVSAAAMKLVATTTRTTANLRTERVKGGSCLSIPKKIGSRFHCVNIWPGRIPGPGIVHYQSLVGCQGTVLSWVFNWDKNGRTLLAKSEPAGCEVLKGCLW